MSERAVIALATHLLVRGGLVATPGRTARDGTPSHVRYVITRALQQALSFKTPALAIAVFDAQPPSLTPELQLELAALPELFTAHGFRTVTAKDAIHVVASYTCAAKERGYDVVIVGSDKRLAQLVDDRTWWYDAYKDVRYTPELVRKRFDVVPARVAEWLAMVGDDDSLHGVKGLGKKSATQLIESYDTMELALEDVAAIEGRVGNALRASVAQTRAELARARLDREAALPRPLDQLAYRAPDQAALQAYYVEQGFLELLSAQPPTAASAVVICSDDAAVETLLARFDRAAPVAVHALSEDPSAVRGELAGIALVQAELAGYVPLRGKGEVAATFPRALADYLEGDNPKLGHDVALLGAALLHHGIRLAGVVFDSACASHLHQPSGLAPHDLSVLAPPLLQRAAPEEDSVRGVGRARRTWAELDVVQAAGYAAALARISADVSELLAATTDRALLEEYLALSETLARMAFHGIACDPGNLARAGADFERIGSELEAHIHALAGHSFNVNSTKQLGTVLFEELGLPVASKTKTGYSTATDALERIENAHPIVPLVIRFRMLRRLTDSWVTALSAAIGDDQRVHASMYAARSFSGRVICANPDLGRVPAKTPEMLRIREAFRAPDGFTLLSVDYEQLGLYVLAHLTQDPALVEPLRQGQDMHTLTAAAVLEIEPQAVGDHERQIGKVVNFATFAGQGASALALQLGVTAQEAKQLIARFDRRYEVVRTFQDEQFRLANERGYIVTLAGRRWPIGDLNSPDAMIRSYAERLARRATHEGSVADVSRRGLLDADRALRAAGIAAHTLLQIHDEVLFEVRAEALDDAARVAADAMRNAFRLEVPLRVGVAAGPSWAELAPLD